MIYLKAPHELIEHLVLVLNITRLFNEMLFLYSVWDPTGTCIIHGVGFR